MFIEAFYIGEVCHAVDGLVTVSDKLPWFILPTEYVGLLFCYPYLSSWIEVGQWVHCQVGRYHNDIGYIYESDKQWDAIVYLCPKSLNQGASGREMAGHSPGHGFPQKSSSYTARSK